MRKVKYIPKEDFERLLEQIKNPPEANEKLKQMFREYNEKIKSGKLVSK